MNHFAKIRAALESIRTCDDMLGERDAAIAALAELERAAAEPVTYQYSHPSGGGKIWRNEQHWNGYTSNEARALYAAPPAPAAEIREVVVTDDSARSLCRAIGCTPEFARGVVRAVQRELGPALGLVELKEPTPEECERISMAYYDDETLVDRDHRHLGKDMLDACRAVLWPKEGE